MRKPAPPVDRSPLPDGVFLSLVIQQGENEEAEVIVNLRSNVGLTTYQLAAAFSALLDFCNRENVHNEVKAILKSGVPYESLNIIEHGEAQND